MRREQGSIVTYILIAIFLSGLLIATLTQGPEKSIDSTFLDKQTLFLKSDLNVVHTLVAECVQVYGKPVDVDGDDDIDADDNPNAPFPLYDDFSHSGAGVDFSVIKCPGAPPADQDIFETVNDHRLKFLPNTADYTALYFNDPVEGVYLRITSNADDFLWEEMISRLDQKLAACSAAVVTDMGDCTNSCLYYWVSRRSTSVIGPEAGCP